MATDESRTEQGSSLDLASWKRIHSIAVSKFLGVEHLNQTNLSVQNCYCLHKQISRVAIWHRTQNSSKYTSEFLHLSK